MNLHPSTPSAYQLFHNGVQALARAEQAGIRIDMEYAEKVKKELDEKISKIETTFCESKLYRHWAHVSGGKVNIHSNFQLANYLYNVKKLKPKKLTVTGKGSTDEDALSSLGIPEINELLYARKLMKLRDTYLNGFISEQVNGYIHPVFNLHLVKTYRSSSDSPNFQNIPKRDEEANNIIRRALFPRPGHQLMEVDYSGIEVKIAACYHKDPVMLNYFKDKASDMHGDMAKQLFCIDKFDKKIPSHNTLRQAAKNGFVFPQFYGDYYKNCAVNVACNWGQLPAGRWSKGQGIDMIGWQPPLNNFHLSDHLISKGIKSLDAFTEHVKEVENDFWNNRFKVYGRWKKAHFERYKKNGYVDLKTGFRCSGVMSRNDVSNYPVQGAAFHCLLWAFTEIDSVMRKEQWDTRLIGQIHDSIILDVNPTELEHVGKVIKQITTKELLKAFDWIIVPMEVEADICPVDGSWAEKQKYEL